MTKNQESFLRELDALLLKYSVKYVRTDGEGLVVFESGDSSMKIGCYDDGIFRGIVSAQKQFDAR